MAASQLALRVGASVLVVVLAGCAVEDLVPIQVPAGGRLWIVRVENQSARPANLVVLESQPVPFHEVGTVKPTTVLAGQTVDVSFGIPPGNSWAIFVNPEPDRGPLVLPIDVPADASGRMPFGIVITELGQPTVEMAPTRPGWFGS